MIYQYQQSEYLYFNNNNNEVNIKLFDKIVHYFHYVYKNKSFTFVFVMLNHACFYLDLYVLGLFRVDLEVIT